MKVFKYVITKFKKAISIFSIKETRTFKYVNSEYQYIKNSFKSIKADQVHFLKIIIDAKKFIQFHF